MGKGRAPCCDKTKVKRGPWSQDEDMKLISFIHKYGHENWRSLPRQAGLLRCGKSCRLRWINYLRPDVKRGNFSAEEEETIIKLHLSLGNKWSKIASKVNSEEVDSKGSLNEEETSQESRLNASISFAGSNISSKENDPFNLDPDICSFLHCSDSSQQPENSLTSRAIQESEEDEVEKWFKHLENELGLEESHDQRQDYKQGKGDEEESTSSLSLLENYELLIN